MYEIIARPDRLRRSVWYALIAIAMCLTAAALLTACGEGRDSTAMSSEVRSDRERAAPSALDTEVAGLVDGNSAFAFDLYQALGGQSGNLFYSPHSISLALSMTYAGAGGQTASQMADTLHFPLVSGQASPRVQCPRPAACISRRGHSGQGWRGLQAEHRQRGLGPARPRFPGAVPGRSGR